MGENENGPADEPIPFIGIPPWGGQAFRESGGASLPPPAGATNVPPVHESRRGESKPEGDTPGEPGTTATGAYRGPLVRVGALDFMAQEDENVQPLAGEPGDALLYSGGSLLMYGRGGAGKTTLTLDAVCHLASGTPWLGEVVPTPLNIIMIENEGRRQALRARLRHRHESWEGNPWAERLELMTDPWMGFTFREERYRQELAAWATDFQANLIIVGPLVTIGAIGAGTPEDVHDFELLLHATRQLVDHELAFWILHHANKQNDVSGAWDRLPDAMLHVIANGHGHTHLKFEKVRESHLSGTELNLSWNDYSYTVDSSTRPTDEENVTRVRELYENDPKPRIRPQVREEAEIGDGPAKKALDTLVESGFLIMQEGPPGYRRNAKVYFHHAWDLAQLDAQLDTAKPANSSGSWASSGQTASGTEGASPNRGGTGPVKGPPPELGNSAPPQPRTPTDIDSDIPF